MSSGTLRGWGLSAWLGGKSKYVSATGDVKRKSGSAYHDECEKITGASDRESASRWAAWLVWERSIILLG